MRRGAAEALNAARAEAQLWLEDLWAHIPFFLSEVRIIRLVLTRVDKVGIKIYNSERILQDVFVLTQPIFYI